MPKRAEEMESHPQLKCEFKRRRNEAGEGEEEKSVGEGGRQTVLRNGDETCREVGRRKR